MSMPTAVVALKAKGDKASIRTAIYQSMQIATKCTKDNVAVIDGIVTFGGTKDIFRELKTIDARKRFDYVIVFSPAQIAKTKQEFEDFVAEVESTFKCKVVWLRTG